ncbi:MAG: EAL domain-containing protein [Alphaproteobacteria bacterium]|nr:EAL domain-containing protein [Alphaproteobacteria bacterium]MBV9371493.1 EAL domain-containing protein [Alphaproteobacteria bacterium]MBV9902765.1 EAL domain-containing protein [Alphaproteobacteria bacterium]
MAEMSAGHAPYLHSDVAGLIGETAVAARGISCAADPLAEAEALNRTIVETSADCIKLLDLEGRVLFVNGPGLCALEAPHSGVLLGKYWRDFWPPEARIQVDAAMASARCGGTSRFSAECPTARGRLKWWDVVVSPVLGVDGRAVKLAAISRDVTERKAVEDRARWNATHDPLTGLPNRLQFRERLGEAIRRADADGSRVGLLHLDLDQFKRVNDELGHEGGDALLKTFAARLQGALRCVDTVARLGGDEFAIAVPGLRTDGEILPLLELLRARLREPFLHEDKILDCQVTIGVGLYPLHGRSRDDLSKVADIALHMAKCAGRGSIMVFEPRMRTDLQRRSSMIELGRSAVEDDRIVPYYQPKVDFASGAVAGFEALLRWRSLRGVMQAPATIAAALEDMDVAAAITDRMLQLALADMRRWRDRGLGFGHVAVNAAAADFRSDDFAERILAKLRRAGVPPKCFQLEVTETVFLGRGAEYVERALKLLSAEGVSIALDDFGTGYASLRHLKQFPVDVIKIDQSFVQRLDADAGDAAIVDAVIKLGKSLGIATVAEGVETRAQADHLIEAGCDFGQGHLFSKAVPARSVPSILARLGRSLADGRAQVSERADCGRWQGVVPISAALRAANRA